MKTQKKAAILYHPSIPYLFILPSFIIFGIFSFLPIFNNFYLAFHKWTILSPIKPYVGINNFKIILQDKVFLRALFNTCYFVGASVFIGIPLALFIALGVNKISNQLIGRIVRTSFFIPTVASMVGVGFIWVWIYDPKCGLLNWFIGLLGIPAKSWLREPQLVMPAIILFSIWKSLGYTSLLFLAGLRSIPSIYYEAAMIDGAGKTQLFKNITLPLLTPTTLFVLVTTVIASFQVFTQVFVLTSSTGIPPGGPANASKVLVIRIYETAFTFYKMGLASAMAIVLFIVVFILSLLQLKLLPQQEIY